jgi:hypothetical protein
LYNILNESGNPIKLVNFIKMCLNETYSRVRVGKNLSNMFPNRNGLKQGDALSPFLFNFVLEYVTTSIQVNQEGLKLNGLCYVNILGGSIHSIKKKCRSFSSC